MNEERKCAKCGEMKPWRRFRVSLGGGRMRDEVICSTCRRARRKSVLNRTAKREAKEAARMLAKQIKEIRTYCNIKTAMDRKYLRDTQQLSDNPYNAEQQRIAIQQANGWINFYREISEHVINTLQETGTRLPINKLEGDPHLQLFHGVHDTQRAQRLRYY